jgi:hypothetical protein
LSDSRPDDVVEEEPDSSGASPPSRLRGFVRFQLKTLLALLVLFAVLRVSHPVYLPPLLSLLANSVGLELRYDGMSLGVLEGTFQATDIVITPLEGGDPIATAKEASGTVDLRLLTEGRFAFELLRVHALQGDLIVDGDGQLALVRRIAAATAARSARKSESKPGIPLWCRRLIVTESAIQVVDHSVSPRANLKVAIQRLDVDTQANARREPGYRAELSIANLAKTLSLSGTWSLPNDSKSDFEITARLDADGVTGGAAAPYLAPLGASSALSAGKIGFDLSASTAPVGSRSSRSRLQLRGLEIQDEGRPLLRCELIDVPTLTADPEARDYSLGAIVVAGVEASLVRRPNGLIEGLGLRSQDVRNPKPSTMGRLTVRSISVGLRDVSWQDLQFKGREALRLRGAQLKIPSFTVEGRRPEAGTAIELSLEGELSPLASRCLVRAQITPTPKVSLELELKGLRSEGFLALLPDLRGAYVADPSLSDGVFRAALELTPSRKEPGVRRGAIRIDVFNAELLSTPRDGERVQLASVASLKIHVDDSRSDTGALNASLFELTQPTLQITQRSDGLRLLGLRRLPPDSQVQTRPTDSTGPERRVDKLHVAGAEIDYRDERTQPPTRFPVVDLDLEVHGFSMRALTESRPVSFRATARGGPVPLDGVTTGNAFESATLEGQLVLHPHLTGAVSLWAKNVELPNLREAAKKEGIAIRAGLLDVKSKATFSGERPTRLDAELTFRKLKVSEPLGGAVGEALSLPAPLDVLIPVIRDAKEEIRIPIHVSLGSNGLISEGTWRIVAPAMGQVIGRAFRDSPLKIAGLAKTLGKGVAKILPKRARESLLGPKTPERLPTTLEFGPGDRQLKDDQIERLAPLIETLRDGHPCELILQHELGDTDVTLLAARATPKTTELNALLRGLDTRRRQLLHRRRRARDVACAALRGNDDAAALRAREELRRLDQDLGTLARSTENTHRLLMNQSNWDRSRRTREGTLALGKARLEAVRGALLRAGVPNLSGRIRLRPPVLKARAGHLSGTVRVQPKPLEEK